MFQVTVTIGRNVGAVPLSNSEWGQFGNRAADALTIALGVTTPDIEVHHSDGGIWQGVREDSTKISVLLESAPSETQLRILRDELRILRDEFRQDAIALSVAESELI